jgi:hypothetical protein
MVEIEVDGTKVEVLEGSTVHDRARQGSLGCCFDRVWWDFEAVPGK